MNMQIKADAMFACVVIIVINISFASAWPGIATEVTLNTGYKMPYIAQGTDLLLPPDMAISETLLLTYNVENVTQWALEYGFRHINTARDYGVEKQIGRALRTIMKKLKEDENTKWKAYSAVEDSLEKLDLEYVDLFLMYKPEDPYVENVNEYLLGWNGLLKVKEDELARTIGMSHIDLDTLKRIKKKGVEMPSVLLIDWSLNNQQRPLVKFCKENNITVMGSEPIRPFYVPKKPYPKYNDPNLVEMSKRYKKSVIQIVLRFAIHEGIVPVQTSYTLLRIFRNIHIFFGFMLHKTDRETLKRYDNAWLRNNHVAKQNVSVKSSNGPNFVTPNKVEVVTSKSPSYAISLLVNISGIL